MAKKATKILIVEDEVIIGMQLSSQLKQFGYEVEDLVLSGEKAIEKARELRPNLIMMDIKLKGELDGIQAANQIKELGIPVIFLTSYEDEKTLLRAKEALPYGYLIKPYKKNELKNAIEIALYKHDSEQKLKQRESWLNSVLSGLNDLIIATDSVGKITLVNSPVRNFLGLSEGDLLGKQLDQVCGILQDGKEFNLVNLLSEFDRAENTHKFEKKFFFAKDRSQTIPVQLTINLLKDSSEEDVIKGIVLNMRDLSKEELLEKKIKQNKELLLQQLTERERETLQYLVDGKGTKDIAVILDISPRTVEYHRQNIMKKFDLHDLTGLVHFALSNHLVEFSNR